MAYLRCTGNSGGSLKLRTAQGEIASFETNIVDLMQEVKCSINPIQDLHGYDHPWPAGGGKNKLETTLTSQTLRGVIFTVNADGTFTANGTATDGYSQVTVGTISLPAGDYVISDEGNFERNNDIELYISGTPSASTKYLDNRSFTLTSPITNAIVYFFIGNGKSINTTIKPMIRPASEPAGFASYENVCPINGYSSANITRCGVNLYSDIFSEYRKPVNYYIKNIPLKVGTTYTLKAELKSGGTPQTNVAFGVANKGEQYSEFDSRIMCITIGGTTSTYTFAPTSAWTSPKLICYVSGETEFEDVFDNYEIILVEGSSATYPPYNGQTYTIAFGQTVYGGVLDVTRGKLHVKWSNAVDLGLLGWAYDVAQQVFVTTDFVGYKNGTPFLCDVYTDLGAVAISQITNCGGTLRGVAFYIKNTDYTDAPTFKTAMSGKYITAELAAPFDIDLTPEVISSVVGTNNVFADCGETEVKYLYLE